MEQLMRRDRSAFNDLIFDHFKNVEEESRKWSESTVELERRIDARDARIRKLEAELEVARAENRELSTVEDARRKRTLQPSSDNGSENKENIDPDHLLKTLDVAVASQLETPAKDPKPLNLSSDDDGKQGEGVRTMSMGSSPPPAEHYREVHDSYVKLQEEYGSLQRECDMYKSALDTLKKHHRKDKLAWKAWTEQDLARRAKRKGTRPRTPSPITPATSIPKSSPPRPPQISPEKKEHDLGFIPESVRKGGLFSHLQPSRPARFSPDQTNRKERTPAGEDLPGRPSSTSSISIAETLEQNQPELPIYNPNPNPSTMPKRNDVPSSDATTDDSGPEENQITPKAGAARKNPMPPPPFALEKLDSGRAGSTPFKPVVIKSEPVSSQSDPGYFVFDQGSLDLDDVGPELEEEAPRKKRKVETAAGVGSTHVGVEPEPEEVPVLKGVQLRQPSPSGVRSASQLVHPKTPEAKAAPRHSPPAPPSAVRRPGGFTTSTRTPAKDPLRHSGAIPHILEDGTDGTRAIANPPSTNRKRLGRLLSTPAPPSPSLRPLLRGGVNTRSTPSDGSTKRKIHGANLITPTATTAQGKKQQLPTPTTDPPLPRVAAAAAPKLTDFKINPAANGGLDFAYAETVRGKEARKCLPGCMRPCCREVGRFVEAAGLPKVEKKIRWRSSSPVPPDNNDDEEEGAAAVGGRGKDGKRETEEFLQTYGKHKDVFPRHTTPPGFWNSEFPDSLELEQYREQADMMEMDKVEERRREAEKGKGKGGRFVRR